MKKISWLIFVLFVQFSFGQEVSDSTSSNSNALPTIDLSDNELDNEQDNELGNISSLLQGSRDVFMNTAGYTFGAARFKIRGYGSENTSVFMNGIPVNDIEGGRVYWGLWGGLNDVMRNKQNVYGLSMNQFAFGGIAGATQISTRASKYRKNISASYAISNRSYRNRVMLTYATGLMKNNWAIAASISKRWAQEGYQEGTSYDAYAYFIAIEKKLNKKHSLNLSFFGSPSKRGKAGGSVQEVYDLLDNHYYNPNWGYQNGEKRNAKVATSHQPQLMLSHYFDISNKTKITTTAAYGFGSYATTALDWYNTRDPRPDYYRYLPSYYDDLTAQTLVKDEFKENHQLDWDKFYATNKANKDGRSSYILENRITDYNIINVNTTVNHKLTEKIALDGGLRYTNYKGRHYKTINDLLGGEYYLDIDKFAERDNPNDPNMIDNDLNNPDKVRKVGDVLGNDYDMNQQKYKAWTQVSAEFSKIDLFAAFNVSQTMFWRTGHMKNGKFPEHSYGESEKESFFNYGVKGGATYKMNGRNYFYADGYFGTRAPLIRNSYISPRTRDYTVDGLKNETIYSLEGGYHLRSPKVKARVSAYYTQFKDATQIYSFYNDLYNNYTNQIITGIDKRNFGLEIGSEVKVTSTINASLVAAIGQNVYTNRPTGFTIQDNDATTLVEGETIYQQNYHQANGPEQAYSLGVEYRNPHYWFVKLNANYFMNNYLQFNPTRRTTAAISDEYGDNKVEEGSDLYNSILSQEKLNDAFTLDFFGGKSWKIKGYYIYVNAGVNNILNNTDFITGGYEQRRFDYKNRNVDKFPPKYFYGYGVNYFISLGVRL